VEQLPSKGIKHIALICPGFSSDCLETIEEINMEAREIFTEAGGEKFHYIPCLNDSEEHIRALSIIIDRYLAN
jgi:ferrochelatase